MREQYRWQRRSLRRGSIVGPMVLLALGVIFLLEQTGRLSWAHSFAWYARWWPAVLIVAGLILLLEWMFDQQHLEETGRPAADACAERRRSVSADCAGVRGCLRTVDGEQHGMA